VIANTLFKQKKENRCWTWESPGYKVHNQIDYIIISRKWRSSITNARAYPSADIGSDHQLLIANLKLKLKRYKVTQPMKRFDIAKLKDPQVSQMYEITIGGKFAALLENEQAEEVGVEGTRTAIKAAFNNTSMDTLGVVKSQRTNQWLSDRTRQLADERRALKPKKRESAVNTRHYNFLGREIKRCGNADKEAYLNAICRDVEEANTQNKSRIVYQSVGRLTGKKEMRVRTIRDKLGVAITDPKKLKDRWKEHFEELYNDTNTAEKKF
jgi:hypothetical protein